MNIPKTELHVVENFFGHKIGSNLVAFLERNHGWTDRRIGTIKINQSIPLSYELADDLGSTTACFYKVFSTKEIIESFEYRSYLEEFKEHFELDEDYVETEFLLPLIEIADGSALYVAIHGKREGKLYVVDCGDFGITMIPETIDQIQSLLDLNKQSEPADGSNG